MGKIRDYINSKIKKTFWYREVAFRDCIKFWDLKDDKYQVVNLGSNSGVYDFCYDNLPIRAANWAVGPQSIVGDFAILQQYRKHLDEHAVVVYPLCPFTSISGAAQYIEERCYSFLDFARMPNAHFLSHQKIMSIKINPIEHYPLIHLFYSVRRWLKKSQSNKSLDNKELETDAERWMINWKSQFQINDLSIPFEGRNKVVYSDGAELMKRMSLYCQSEGLRFIIVIPPAHVSLCNKFRKEDIDNLIERFIEDSNLINTEYYNMFYLKEFSTNSKLFRNSYFLNDEGAKKYTSYLINKIKI